MTLFYQSIKEKVLTRSYLFRCKWFSSIRPTSTLAYSRKKTMNFVIWDIESSSASTDFGSIIEIGGILVDENFKEKDRFNLRCRLPEGEIPQAMALIVNKTSIDKLTKVNLSHYQMLGEVEKIFKKMESCYFFRLV